MNKLFVLVKKEIRELLTPQTILPLVMMVVIFVFIGRAIGKESTKMQVSQPIQVLDLDNSDASRVVINILNQSNFIPEVKNSGDSQEFVNNAKTKGDQTVIVIPAGFEKGLDSLTPQKISVYNFLNSFAVMASLKTSSLATAFAKINNQIGNQILSQTSGQLNPAIVKQPVVENDFVTIGNRTANISPSVIGGFVSSQTYFIPIIMLVVIILASQMIAVSIASEKENKTLETLLSTPVNRQLIITSKLMGAGIVSLISAGIYMFGLRYYINGIAGMQASTSASGVGSAIAQLGLNFTTANYVLVGLSLFLGILSALSIAIILGIFAEDTKSAQGVTMPLMILVLIPYFVTMFFNASTLSPVLRWIIYAIPFSHPFMAATNILLGRTQNVWLGIGYMAIFFAVFVYIASKIFASDKILTMKLRFKRKLL